MMKKRFFYFIEEQWQKPARWLLLVAAFSFTSAPAHLNPRIVSNLSLSLSLGLLSFKFSPAETSPLQCKLCIIQIRKSSCGQERGTERDSDHCSKYQRTFEKKNVICSKACKRDKAVGKKGFFYASQSTEQ